MEVAPRVQEVSSHAALLLASLNLQREQAQFCDCVVIQKQNPGHLYPAHRCVLSAASPVLASILSSTGALVELQAPCLSDSVLALLLAYIYTGALPYSPSQQQYYNLLTAASYLQMEELQETLMAWQQLEVNAADNANAGVENQHYQDSNVTYCKTVNTFGKYLPSSHSCSVNSLEREDHQKSSDVDTQEDIVRTVEDWRSLQVSCSNEVQEAKMSRMEKTQGLCLTVTSKAEEKQSDREEDKKTDVLQSYALFRSTSDLNDSVSPSQCSGAVPVICHSSRAAMLQQAEVSTLPPYHPVSQDLESSSTDNDSIVNGIFTKSTACYGAQNHDYRNNKKGLVTQKWDCKDSSDQCATEDVCYKSNTNHSDILKPDCNSSNTDPFIRHNDKHTDNGLPHTTDHNDHHAYWNTFLSVNHTKRLRDNSLRQGKDRSNFTRGFKFKTDLNVDDFPSKRQQLDCSDVPMATAAEQQAISSQGTRATVPIPVQDSDTGSDSYSEDLCPKGESKEERIYSSIEDPSYSQHERDSDNRDLAMTDERRSVDVSITSESSLDSVASGLSACERCTSLELENTSSTDITEPNSTFTIPEDNMSDPTCYVVGQSYRGHVHYQCLPQEDTQVPHGDCSRPAHSDQYSDAGKVGPFASPVCSPLRQHFATRTTDQVLLLDISSQPAELLVSYKHRSDDREQWNDATSITRVDKRKSRDRIKFGAKTKSWVGESTPTKSAPDQSRPGTEVIHEAGFMDGANQIATLTVCSPPSVPDSAQAYMSSTLSVWIPPTLSASVHTNGSAHLSTPVHHPFQCSLCDRSFSQRGSLNRHVRSHLGVRPFPCPRCPMTFSRQYRVTEHMRVHQRCALGGDLPKHPASSI